MNYLSIIEENFTKADYVAYLRGCILQALLEDKPLDLPQFKLYADKLVDILEEQPEQPTVPLQIKSFDYTTVDLDEPQVQPKPKFNIGDRVIIKYNDFTGTIVRLPMAGVDFSEGYVVELDDNCSGWIGTYKHDGVDCKNEWFASEKNLELINEASLQANKWYHTYVIYQYGYPILEVQAKGENTHIFDYDTKYLDDMPAILTDIIYTVE